MGDLSDFQGFGRALQQELDKLDHHHPDDHEHVKAWVRHQDGRVEDSSLSTYLRNIRTASGLWDAPLTSLDHAGFDELAYQLRHHADNGQGGTGYSDATVYNIQNAVRGFLKVAHENGVDGLAWADDYEIRQPDTETVHPGDMLDADAVAALRGGCLNMRDVALVEFMADTGARISMVGSLRVGDLDLDGEKATYTPNPDASGLKGAAITEYPIIDAAATLRAYLRDVHPRPDRGDVAFFHKLPGTGVTITEGDDGALSPPTIRKQLRKAAERGDVDKPVNPHNFKHSAVTRMAREGYTRSQIEHRVQWELDSNMWEVYEHITGEEHNQDIFAKAGVGEAEAGPDASRRPCGNCNEPLPPHLDVCPKCHTPVTEAARRQVRMALNSLVSAAADTSDPERGELHAEATDQLQFDPRDLIEPFDHPDAPPSSKD